MKHSLLLAGVVLVCAMPAFATVTPGSGGQFVMYSNASYTECNLLDTGAALEVVYIVHEFLPCATAGQFKLDNHGYTASWISDSYLGNLAIGDSQMGLALSYGANVATPYPMVNVTYFGAGTTPPCAYLGMVPDPIEPDGIIAATDCQFLKHQAYGTILPINPDNSCREYFCISATKESNWSRIKNLYRQ